ncbi:tubulin polymerization-promoting protein homolog [Harmonia axyridis]|uniref:tubulin polymerization-promoting protein homolog n=1 Tax=Harmonia axyridis TaxID=115357 RepID=UPI001E2763C4|nr:tubulin polymerization-promoting protein homolog [Harmonia axyridis]
MSMENQNETNLRTKFIEFSEYKSKENDTNGISLKQLDLWLEQARILDMNRITTTDTGILFLKFGTRRMDFQQFLLFLRKLAAQSGDNLTDIFEKLAKCEKPTLPAWELN